MYILPTLTYLEVGGAAGASKIFIFEHFKWEPMLRWGALASRRPTAAFQRKEPQKEPRGSFLWFFLVVAGLPRPAVECVSLQEHRRALGRGDNIPGTELEGRRVQPAPTGIVHACLLYTSPSPRD